MTTKEIRERLEGRVAFSSLSRKGEVFTLRRGFFYTHGFTAEKYCEQVKTVFPTAVIVDSGEIWKPFRGGAKVSAQSYFYVSFYVQKETSNA